MPLTVSPVHSRSSGWCDGRIKGETPFAASGDHWKLCPCWKLSQFLLIQQLAGWFPQTLGPAAAPASGLWDTPGVYISQVCRSDRTHRKSLSGFPLSAVLAVGHFLVTVCRSLGYSLLPPSPPPLRSPLPSGSSLTCFLAFWVLLVGSGWQVCRRMLQGLRGHWSCSLSLLMRKQIQRGEAGPLGTHSE